MEHFKAPASPPAQTADDLCARGALQMARCIAAREISASELLEQHIARIEAVNPRLNALVVERFAEARAEAAAADRALRSGESLGPLHGVPVSIKECHWVAGTPTTIGISERAGERATENCVLVERLRRAGAIVLGKTNVPQLLLMHETDNPVYGRSNNPWNLDRTPGGSTGGEAALIAAGGSPLGLGGDIGGSTRVPAHWCGLHGLKPTRNRLPKGGRVRTLHGMEALVSQPGPLARRVEDVAAAFRILLEGDPPEIDCDAPPAPFRDPRDVEISRLRVAYWEEDGYFAPSPAVRRAVREGVAALERAGVEVVRWNPPDVEEALELYFALINADGSASMARQLGDSEADDRVARMIRLGGTALWLRPIARWLLGFGGDYRLGELFTASGAISADAYWQRTHQARQFRERFVQAYREAGFDALVCPPHALPALRHGQALDLLPAASYSFLFNLLDLPCGVVAATTVQAGEESDRDPDATGADASERRAAKAERDSVGLPIGVQVVADFWREDLVLAVMESLEAAFRESPTYPTTPPLVRDDG